jgi:hypothetical protein
MLRQTASEEIDGGIDFAFEVFDCEGLNSRVKTESSVAHLSNMLWFMNIVETDVMEGRR